MKISYLPLPFVLASSSATAFVPTLNHASTSSRNSRLFYDIQRDPSSNAWSVLANTERWISTTLQEAQQGGNPLTRKEVSYVCETSQDPVMVVANIFRKLKEARQLGEIHGQDQEELFDANEAHERVTLRQTQVLVIPASEEIMSFPVFDSLMTAINQARRSARDYVTDVSLDRLDENMYGEGDREWCVSVNCAHLHPNFGYKTPEQELKELQEEEEEGEVDLNLEEYKKRRLQARQSPYPSVVVEVRAMIPPVFSPPPPSGPTTPDPVEEIDEPISSEVVQSLEALFSKSSLQKDGSFYNSIGSHIETISSITPLSVAQNWIADNNSEFDFATCAFTTTTTAHIDEAYEFVFTNLAMQTSEFNNNAGTSSVEAGAQKQQYLVMPNFVTSSATSMEKFAIEVSNIIETLPSVKGKVQVGCLHPEHIQDQKRCPVPVFTLHWLE